MSVTELREIRHKFNYNLGSEIAQFAGESQHLFQLIDSLRSLEAYYRDNLNNLVISLQKWNSSYFSEVKYFMTSYCNDKVKLTDLSLKDILSKLQYPKANITDLLNTTYDLKKDLSVSEREIKDKFNNLLNIQNDLIDCNKNVIQVQSLVESVKKTQEEVYNPILVNEDQKENTEPESSENTTVESNVLVDKNSVELDNLKNSQKSINEVFKEEVANYNTKLELFEGQYNTFLEKTGDIRKNSLIELQNSLESGKNSYTNALKEFNENYSKLLETPLTIDLEKKWVCDLDKGIMPKNIEFEVALKQTMNMAEQLADKNWHKKMIQKEQNEFRNPLSENINELNTQQPEEEESFFVAGFNEMKQVFKEIGTNIRESFNLGRDDKKRKKYEDVREFLEEVIFESKYDYENFILFQEQINSVGSRRDVVKYFKNLPKWMFNEGIDESMFKKILDISTDYLNSCQTASDYLDAVLFYIAAQEIHYYSREEKTKIYLANEIAQHDILQTEEFWISLYTHLYRRQQHYLKMKINPDIKRLLTRESFYKNFEFFKFKLDKKESLLNVLQKVNENLKLGEFDGEAELLDEVREDLTELWENYRVDAQNMCLVSLNADVQDILEQKVPSTPEKDIETEKKEAPAPKEEEFTPIKDQNSETEEPEVKAEPKETLIEENNQNVEQELQDYPNQDALEQIDNAEPLEDNTGVKPEIAEGDLSHVTEPEKEGEQNNAEDSEKKAEIKDENNPYRTKLFKLKSEFRHFILE